MQPCCLQRGGRITGPAPLPRPGAPTRAVPEVQEGTVQECLVAAVGSLAALPVGLKQRVDMLREAAGEARFPTRSSTPHPQLEATDSILTLPWSQRATPHLPLLCPQQPRSQGSCLSAFAFAVSSLDDALPLRQHMPPHPFTVNLCYVLLPEGPSCPFKQHQPVQPHPFLLSIFFPSMAHPAASYIFTYFFACCRPPWEVHTTNPCLSWVPAVPPGPGQGSYPAGAHYRLAE